jgi:pantetheine-phosphate adenylyltransferase
VTLALCPGSFDPVTNGHLDIIERAARHFEKVIVAVIANPSKQPLFSLEERTELLRECVRALHNVRVDSFEGLLVDYAQREQVGVVVKGLRAVSDFDYEIQMAQMNHRLSGLDTYFLPTRSEYSYLSASLVREIARFGGNIEGLVPENVRQLLEKRFAG